MEYNGKNYELIHDKTGNLDCPDCAFRNIDCSVTEAVNKCNMYQVWKECAQEKETEQQSNCNLPHVSNLVCPTHGTMLYKHPNGLAYCSLCNYSISWQTCC